MNQAPNCLKCEHFFITYQEAHPRGCRIFGIKSKMLPSRVVFNSSGAHCPAFELKRRLQK